MEEERGEAMNLGQAEKEGPGDRIRGRKFSRRMAGENGEDRLEEIQLLFHGERLYQIRQEHKMNVQSSRFHVQGFASP
jgi:hypothetical protein